MKAKFVFAYFLYLAPMLAMSSKIAEFSLTEDSILNKNHMGSVPESLFTSIYSDELFYSGRYGSARPTCTGTFLNSSDYLYFNTGNYLENALSFSFWFYPGDKNEGYVWSFAEDFLSSAPFYVLYNDETLEFGVAKWNETDEKATKVGGYKQNQWHLLLITLENDVDADETSFKVLDPISLKLIVDSVYPARESFSNMWVSMGNYNMFTNGFSGFVYDLALWSSDFDEGSIASIYKSSSCTGSCDICPTASSGDSKCLDFGCIYPAGAHEFDPIKLCDPTCDDYCSGTSNKDATAEKDDSSCSACMSLSLDDGKGSCVCPEGKGRIFIRGQLSGCNDCSDGCEKCDTSGDSPVCSDCADPAAIAGQKDCQCPAGYIITSTSLGFCVMNCDKECESCADGEPAFCYSCSYQLATSIKGVCQCKPGYFATNSIDEPLDCEACDPKCSECEGAADYCTECSDEGWVALDGNCVCDHGFYPSSDIVDGENVATCAPCSEGCDKCDKNCFMCTDINNSDGQDNCFTSSLGYQMKFRRGIITVTFSQELDKPLDKYDFNVQDKEGKWHDATYWDISMVSPSEYKIFTDLTKDDLPVQVFFTFAKVDDVKPDL